MITALLFDRFHTIKLPPYLGFFGGRRFVPIVVSLAALFLGMVLSYFYPLFNSGLTSVGAFIGDSGAWGPSSTASSTECSYPWAFTTS